MALSLAGNGVRWPPPTSGVDLWRGATHARPHRMCVRRTARKERINVAYNSRDLWRMTDLTLFPSGSSI
eukprot:5510188-Prymnesium_polylepis.1